MGSIRIITPVHIGSDKKEFIIRKNNFIYSFNKILENQLEKMSTEQILLNCNRLSKIKNPSKNDLLKTLNIDENSFSSNELISLNKNYGKFIEEESNNLYLIQKTLDKVFIPGSTLKGVFNNLFWYDALSDEKIGTEIKRRLNNLEKNNDKVKKIFDKLNNPIKKMKSFLKVSDVIFDCEPLVFTIKRYNSKNQIISGNGENYECIPIASIKTSDIVKDLSTSENIILNKIKNEALETINDDEITKLIIEKYYDFVKNLKTSLKEINKKFMISIIEKEIDFIENSSNDYFDHMQLKSFYTDIKTQLLNGKMIMRVGKFTSFLHKTYFFELNETYTNLFKKYFSPNKLKTKPIIESINLTKIDNNYYPLGFIELIL